MVKFNPDGSIKLPNQMQKNREENKARMSTQRCIRIRRELASTKPPKKCILHLTLSDAVADNRFVETLFLAFQARASVPCKLARVDDKTFDIEIGTDFRRCTDCNSLVRSYREFFDSNVIEDKGSCSFEERDWCDEDYFS